MTKKQEPVVALPNLREEDYKKFKTLTKDLRDHLANGTFTDTQVVKELGESLKLTETERWLKFRLTRICDRPLDTGLADVTDLLREAKQHPEVEIDLAKVKERIQDLVIAQRARSNALLAIIEEFKPEDFVSAAKVDDLPVGKQEAAELVAALRNRSLQDIIEALAETPDFNLPAFLRRVADLPEAAIKAALDRTDEDALSEGHTATHNRSNHPAGSTSPDRGTPSGQAPLGTTDPNRVDPLGTQARTLEPPTRG